MFHEIEIPNETRQQSSEAKKDRSAIRAQRISVREGARGKWRPESHQYAGDYTNEDTSARGLFPGLQFAIRFAVQNHRGYSAKYSRRKHVCIASMLLDVTQHDTDHQRDSYGDGKRRRESHQINSRHE